MTPPSPPQSTPPAEKNFKLTLEYDGTPYSGWQVQADRITVQGELQKAISRILNQPVHLVGSGRTDAGVHAMGQVANVKAITRISPEDLQKGVNSLIKGPIVVTRCETVAASFHARYSARSKTYHYHILNRELPCAVGRNHVWHVRKPLDLDRMNRCCKILVGTHDFKSFEGSGSPRSSTVRTLVQVSVEKVDQPGMDWSGVEKADQGGMEGSGKNERIVLKIKGDGFLRFMVRNITGTLVMAGHHKITPNQFREILDAGDRGMAGATAPPQGLFLMRVDYTCPQTSPPNPLSMNGEGENG